MSFDLKTLVRPAVQNLQPYQSARTEYVSQQDALLLDANENPFGDLNRYPDPSQTALKKSIAKWKGVNPENIFLGNGSDEAIDLLFRIFCQAGKDTALQFTPTYGMYAVSAAINEVEMLSIPLLGDFGIPVISTWPDGVKLIFICSPNNPTGNTIDRSIIRKACAVKNAVVVVDEAYVEFSGKSMLFDINSFPNLVVLQTFSKAWGLAGLRLGMAFANPQIIALFQKIKPPYNISSVTQQLALEKIASADLLKSTSTIIGNRKALEMELAALPLVQRVFPSEANFLLVQFENATRVYQYLTQQKIIVRNRATQVDGCLRITVGTKAENSRLLAALKSISV